MTVFFLISKLFQSLHTRSLLNCIQPFFHVFSLFFNRCRVIYFNIFMVGSIVNHTNVLLLDLYWKHYFALLRNDYASDGFLMLTRRRRWRAHPPTHTRTHKHAATTVNRIGTVDTDHKRRWWMNGVYTLMHFLIPSKEIIKTSPGII